jgi:hypothetical protein
MYNTPSSPIQYSHFPEMGKERGREEKDKRKIIVRGTWRTNLGVTMWHKESHHQ